MNFPRALLRLLFGLPFLALMLVLWPARKAADLFCSGFEWLDRALFRVWQAGCRWLKI